MIDFFVNSISIVSAVASIIFSLVEMCRLRSKRASKTMDNKLFVITTRAEEFVSVAQTSGQEEAAMQERRHLILGEVWERYKANMRLKAYLEEQLNPARYEMLLELLWRKKFGKQERLQKILHDLYAQSTVYMTFGKDQRDKMHGWVYSHLTVKDWEKRKPYAVTFKNIAARQHFISYKMLGLTEEPGIFSFKAKNHPYECYREIVVSSTSGAPWMVLIHFPPDEEKAAKPEYYLKMTEEEFEDLTRNGTSTLCLPPARDYRKSD